MSKSQADRHDAPSMLREPVRYLREAPENRVLLALIAVAFMIRLVAYLVVVTKGVEPFFDEIGYVQRAQAYSMIFKAFLAGTTPTADLLDTAYGAGVWPPLHPMLLGLAFMVFGPHPAVARLIVVVLSTLTTPVLFKLTHRLLNRDSAIAASLAFAAYPSFVAFSHFLWSETTYIFFYLLCILFIVRVRESEHGKSIILQAALAGLCLGLAGLTRAIVLLSLFALPTFMAVSFKGGAVKRWAAPLIVCAVAVLTLLPWVTETSSREGELIPLSSQIGLNLYVGNNPWADVASGSSWGNDQAKAKVNHEVRRRAEHEGISTEKAAKELALREILAGPWRFVLRSLARARMLMTVDVFILRHLYRAAYPPVVPGIAACSAVLLMILNLVYFSLMVTGVAQAPCDAWARWLLLIAAASHMIPPLATVAMSRLFLPVLVLLAPFAGWAVVRLFHRPSRTYWSIAAASGLGFLLLVVTSYPVAVTTFLEPSSYYRNAILWGADDFADEVVVAAQRIQGADAVHIEILSEGYRFHHGDRRLTRGFGELGPLEMRLKICAENPEGPLRMAVTYRGIAHRVELEPIHAASWWQWTPASDPRVQSQWRGGRAPCR